MEQYLVAKKARLFKEEPVWERTMLLVNPNFEQKRLGRCFEQFDQAVWKHHREQNPDRKYFLQDSGDNVLAEGNVFDLFCGILRANEAPAPTHHFG